MTQAAHRATFDHVGFITSDIETSITFWRDVMGFDPQPVGERRQEWISKFIGVPGAQVRLVHLFGHGAHIEFIEFFEPTAEPVTAAANQPTVAHVCLRVDDVDDWRARILDGGGSLQGETVAITEGMAQGLRGLYMKDPHGILIELVESPQETDG